MAMNYTHQLTVAVGYKDAVERTRVTQKGGSETFVSNPPSAVVWSEAYFSTER